jgi:glycosyltransferase involved in cell wall biosynthesis
MRGAFMAVNGVAHAPADDALPTVSVVTPSFNSEAYIGRTIESIRRQGHAKLEHVLMDGGSTDGTMEVVARYGGHFAHVESAPDKGMYDAIHRGFARTTGEIMTWLNSDDEWLPGTLATVVRLFREFPEVEWITSGFPCAIDDESATIATARLSGFSRRGIDRGENLAGCGWPADGFIQQESTFWRRSLWERAGARLDTSLQFAGDYELWSRFIRHAPLWQVEVPLGLFRRRAGQKTAVAFARYTEEARGVFERDGGRAPTRLGAMLRVGLRRHLPPEFKRRLGRWKLLERRPFLLYDWSRAQWVRSWH